MFSQFGGAEGGVTALCVSIYLMKNTVTHSLLACNDEHSAGPLDSTPLCHTGKTQIYLSQLSAELLTKNLLVFYQFGGAEGGIKALSITALCAIISLRTL